MYFEQKEKNFLLANALRMYTVPSLFCHNDIHTLYIYKYTPTYLPPPFSNPTHETNDQIGMALDEVPYFRLFPSSFYFRMA